MFFSIVIPFYNSNAFIKNLTDALLKQTLDKNSFEIFFINNRSLDKGTETIKNELSQSGLKYQVLTFNDFPSSYASRNIGVKEATGDILAFTDADCIPAPTWLQNIADVYSENNDPNLVVSGRAELEIEDERNPWELFDHHFHMDNTKAEKNARVATANMAVRKAFFEEVGYFEEVTSGADHKWSEQAAASGAVIKYVPDVLVMHPTRKTKKEIVKKVIRTSRGLGEMSSRSAIQFSKGFIKTMLRPFLIHRHLRFAFSEHIRAGLLFRLKLFGLSFAVRCYQVPAFFRGVFRK